MPVFNDQMKRGVEIKTPPQRIISLVPSQTELLFDLGLDQDVIGITKFCVHPRHWLKQKTIVGGTKKLNIKKINQLNPDLIIGNKEENKQEDIELLMQKYPVWMSDVNNFNDALEMIDQISQITQSQNKGRTLIQKISNEFNGLDAILNKKRVAYFIWNNPMMVAGKQTFINAILEKMGAINVFDSNYLPIQNSYRYPQISAEDLYLAAPQVIFLSSEPFPFKEMHRQLFQQICPNAEIKLVDGEMFSWYGSRLLKAPAYFKSLIQ
jgi:ABC-type Fe3+-hydroxamate transport system substrate-binding protein